MIKLLILTITLCSVNYSQTILEEVEHGFVYNNGVKIHYATTGSGPIIVMLHGFPDFWYGWKSVIPKLKEKFRLIIPDMRGYNLSDKPKSLMFFCNNFKSD